MTRGSENRNRRELLLRGFEGIVTAYGRARHGNKDQLVVLLIDPLDPMGSMIIEAAGRADEMAGVGQAARGRRVRIAVTWCMPRPQAAGLLKECHLGQVKGLSVDEAEDHFIAVVVADGGCSTYRVPVMGSLTESVVASSSS